MGFKSRFWIRNTFRFDKEKGIEIKPFDKCEFGRIVENGFCVLFN